MQDNIEEGDLNHLKITAKLSFTLGNAIHGDYERKTVLSF
tara:strand:- start:96 stop:215 length:120 start_codon:yes stop_codon:yes gene_type:complete